MPQTPESDDATVQRLEEMVADRTRYLELTRDIADVANRAASIREALGQALDRICSHNSWSFCHAYLAEDAADPSSGLSYQPVDQANLSAEMRQYLGDLARQGSETGLVQQAFESGEPQWGSGLEHSSLADLSAERAQELGVGATYVFPVITGEQVVGVLEFFAEDSGAPDDAVRKTMATVGGLLARVVERHRLQRQVTLAVWNEQRRAGQRIHDTLSQEITGLSLLAGSLKRQLEAGTRPESDLAGELVEAIRTLHRRVRGLSRGLYASEVAATPDGLHRALDDLCRETQDRFEAWCELIAPEPVVIEDREVATQLFFIAREAVSNALRHGAATHVKVRLERQPSELILEVTDDGRGFSTPSGEGLGLNIMRYRADVLGAHLKIESEPGSGTRVFCCVPMAPDPDSGCAMVTEVEVEGEEE